VLGRGKSQSGGKPAGIGNEKKKNEGRQTDVDAGTWDGGTKTSTGCPKAQTAGKEQGTNQTVGGSSHPAWKATGTVRKKEKNGKKASAHPKKTIAARPRLVGTCLEAHMEKVGGGLRGNGRKLEPGKETVWKKVGYGRGRK